MKTSSSNFSVRTVVQVLAYFILMPLVPIIISGNWDWWQGWAYGLLTISATAISRVIAMRKHPELLAERGSFRNLPGVKDWDRKLMPFVGMLGPTMTIAVSALDQRFGWSPSFGLAISVFALIMMAIASAFSIWAFVENQFFSAVVRIQTERGHYVIDSGPYRIVRHPGYAGGILSYLMLPLLLDSLWGFIPAFGTIAVLIVRTALEDQTLKEELTGYYEYTQKTKYRLLPGIW